MAHLKLVLKIASWAMFKSVDDRVVLHLKSRSVTSFFQSEKISMAPALKEVVAWPPAKDDTHQIDASCYGSRKAHSAPL